ncbi:hypothetical protein Tco_1314001 [Tanacetum coccineum]
MVMMGCCFVVERDALLRGEIGSRGCETSRDVIGEDDGDEGTDITKISRKRSKPNNHGHGNGKDNTRAGRMLSKGFMGASTNLQGLEASPDGYK